MSVEVSDATFDREVAGSELPVVVEFWASWCGNCRRIAPVVAALGAEFAESVQLVLVNADDNPQLVGRFGVRSTPTFVVLDGASVVATMVGAQPAPVLRGLFETARSTLRAELGVSWVPGDACTLPTAEQPARLAEFDGLFRSVRDIERPGATRLRLVLGETGGVAEQARDLAARESSCCSFFDFTVTTADTAVVIDVQVPLERAGVLDGIAAQAAAARADVASPAGV
jgi:thioredoxin